jgi:ATP-dependent exoDNAse (exonuclease V) beta subunit
LRRVISSGSSYRDWTSYSAEKLRENREGDRETRQSESREIRIGRAFHTVMEFVDFSGERPINQLVRKACVDEGVEDAVDDVGSLVSRVLGSKLIMQAINSGNYFREFQFNVNIGEKYYNGAIDLLYRGKKGFIIVDFKTDKVYDKNLAASAEKYFQQAFIYRTAVEKLTGESVEKVLYYFVRIDKTFEMPAVNMGA